MTDQITGQITGQITDEELTALALAADPDAGLGADAVAIDLWDGDDRVHPLPEWYMPVPMGTPRSVRGWRRVVVLVVVGAFLAINAYGLCSTYGVVAFG